jgi:hypothetical protein
MGAISRQFAHKGKHPPLDRAIDGYLTETIERPVNNGDHLCAARIDCQLISHRPTPGDIPPLNSGAQ